MLFANPAGLWALLGLPAVLAIHFLQRQATVLPVSTLFLLEKTEREAATGRRFDRLISSVPLWLQLLAVIILAWLLAEPRFTLPRSVQRVAVVLDDSASMRVFKDDLHAALAAELPDLQGPAAQLELTLLDAAGARLFSGASIEEALATLDAWRPSSGVADSSRALRIARSVVGPDGSVVYATDTPPGALPFGALALAVGRPIENVGIAGIEVRPEADGRARWTALIRHHGVEPATREWFLRFADGSRSRPQAVTLEPGAIVSLGGELPEGIERGTLVLAADEFGLDDEAPWIVPQPKSLALFAVTSAAFEDLSDRLVRSLDGVRLTNDAASADLTLLAYDPLDPQLPDSHAIVFVDDATQVGAYLKGGIVAEKHPLVDGLNWQSLLVRETIQLERTPQDQVLLWQGQRPLIFLRTLRPEAGGDPLRQLCFNFDLRLSNALTQPAFIVALHRFAESLRRGKVAAVRANLETRQPIELAAKPDEPLARTDFDGAGSARERTTLPPADPARFVAPAEPGFLLIEQGDAPLLEAAVHFADAREADFSAAGSENALAAAGAAQLERHTAEDPWWRLWLLLLFAALLVSWHFARERTSPTPRPTPQPESPLP